MTKKELENKLKALSIPGEFIKTAENGFYIDFYFIFNEKITINKIKARKNDFDFIFHCECEIIPASPYVIIRTPQATRNIVYLSEFKQYLLNNPAPCLAIGKNENGEKIYCNLDQLPHILTAGATGSGKSVFLHDCIISLITGATCELFLIDPKNVEFSMYNGLKCLGAPVATNPETANKILTSLVYIMEGRYITFEENNVRNIKEYNEKNTVKMNYICVIIDEYGDLILLNKTGNKHENAQKISIKNNIIKLAQKARAVGIHIIIATQRPDASIVDGLIKANFPARMCFNVSSRIDSRIILDNNNAANLRGNGDGIFRPATGENIHIQAPFISTKSIIELAEQVKTL